MVVHQLCSSALDSPDCYYQLQHFPWLLGSTLSQFWSLVPSLMRFTGSLPYWLAKRTHSLQSITTIGKISAKPQGFFMAYPKCLTRNWRWNPKILPNSTFVLSIVEDMVLFFSHFFHRPWHPVAAMADPVVRNVGQGERAARHRPRPPAARRAVPRAQSYLDINWIFLNFYSTSCYIYNVYRFYNVFNVYSTYTEYYLLNIL